MAQRARIVFACEGGESVGAVAKRLRLHRGTVGTWRKRFLERRLDGLLDEPRPGAPRTINDADVERVITLTLEEGPGDGTHWSTRSMGLAARE